MEAVQDSRAMRPRRKPIRGTVRAAVIARDGMTCRYCGCEVKHRGSRTKWHPSDLNLDHVTPWAMGGSDEIGNLVVSCARCNHNRIDPPPGSAAENRLLWDYADGDYYWRTSRYRTPSPLPSMYEGFTVDEAAEILECTAGDILVMAARGRVLATGGKLYAIRIRFHPHMEALADRRVYELGWEDE